MKKKHIINYSFSIRNSDGETSRFYNKKINVTKVFSLIVNNTRKFIFKGIEGHGYYGRKYYSFSSSDNLQKIMFNPNTTEFVAVGFQEGETLTISMLALIDNSERMQLDNYTVIEDKKSLVSGMSTKQNEIHEAYFHWLFDIKRILSSDVLDGAIPAENLLIDRTMNISPSFLSKTAKLAVFPSQLVQGPFKCLASDISIVKDEFGEVFVKYDNYLLSNKGRGLDHNSVFRKTNVFVK